MTTLSKTAVTSPYADDVFAGLSPAIQRLRLQVARIAPHFRIALLTGERGVGKHAVAREMHRASDATLPFTVVPIAEFAEGVRRSDASTIYLSGLESLPSSSQRDLLQAIRALDRDTRVILACESDLKGMVSAGKLRHDLYEAVGTLEIRVPPLRDRLDDIEPIVSAMLRRLASTAVLNADALLRLRSYAWPGNLHKLWTLCKELAPAASTITDLDLPVFTNLPSESNNIARLEDVMHRHVINVLQSCSGNKLRAAELLGISRSTLYRMLSSQTGNPA